MALLSVQSVLVNIGVQGCISVLFDPFIWTHGPLYRSASFIFHLNTADQIYIRHCNLPSISVTSSTYWSSYYPLQSSFPFVILQIEMMRQGGNGQIREFYKKLQIENSPITILYSTKGANHYRDRLKERADKVISFPFLQKKLSQSVRQINQYIVVRISETLEEHLVRLVILKQWLKWQQQV